MAAVVGLFIFLLHEAGHMDANRFLDSFLALAGGGTLGGLVFLTTARVVRSEELERLLSRMPRLRRATAR
jgi:hypothetical protein